MAFAYNGEATADIDLNDSGVWVTKGTAALLGRFNYESQALDGSLQASSSSIDVQQDAAKVLLVDSGANTISPVNIAHLKLDATAKIPAEATVRTGASTVAIVDNKAGKLWVLPFTGVGAFNAEKKATLEFAGKAAVTVSRAGTVFLAAPQDKKLWKVATTSDGAPHKETSERLNVDASATVDITAAGERPVVLNREASKLILPGKTVDITDGADARLQQPSVSATSVVVATASTLIVQPLSGDDAQVQQVQAGIPAAPVQLDGCVFGAWAQSGFVVRNCPGTAQDTQKAIEGVDTAGALEYRVNRHSIVLNDLSAGTMWMALDQYQKVDNWDLVVPEQGDGDKADANTDTPEQVDSVLAPRDQPNRPPKANDDTFGVRPGRTTVLPVLANDFDPDGDVITAAPDKTDLSNATIETILGGEALQAVVPADATGTDTFGYTVTDGRGGEAHAQVSVRVVPLTENNNPEETGQPLLVVAQGGTASLKVLPYFRDPDGDDIYLAGASATGDGDEVRFRPDGTVEFHDGNTMTGRKRVDLSVADGQGGVAKGVLNIDVRPANQAPIAVNDHVTVIAGQPVTISPLRNDSDPDGDPLRLASVSQAAPAEIVPNLDAGTVAFRSTEPRSYDLIYQVTDGTNTTKGLIRVDVEAPPDAAGPPIAVGDIAMLPASGSTLVDVLANDTDPAGGVLVVQSVTVPDGAGVSVAVLAHQVLRVSEIHALTGPVTVQYTVSNGTQSAVGEVRVIPIPQQGKTQPPNAVPDDATVHTNDVVTVHVLDNDSHPDGLELILEDKLAENVDPALGTAFVSQDTVRFRAGNTAGTAHATYKVKDRNGQEDSATITIHIRDNKDNNPPQPRDIDARVVAGQSVTIAVPLDGIDLDGDSVSLVSSTPATTKGSSDVLPGGLIKYTAAKGTTGLDTFTYSVVDSRGKTATGNVRVGIAAPPGVNQPPVAVPDRVVSRPDRDIAIPVLDNDYDPEGETPSLVPDGIDDPTGMGAKVAGDQIVVHAPKDTGSYTFYYLIQDSHGAQDSAAVTVEVSPTAPLVAPIARDDIVPQDKILGKDRVAVNVLENDQDPDGVTSDLVVTLPGVPATTASVGAKGVVTVTLGDVSQILMYQATDRDNLTGSAFIWVPAKEAEVPRLRTGIVPLEVVSGQPLSIDITKYVDTRSGTTPKLTSEDKVQAVQGTREVTGATTIVYTSTPGFVGDAWVSFEVTDGSGADDPNGRTASLRLPIKVLPPANTPPTFTNGTLNVAAGEEASLDLGLSAQDADGDPLKFAVTSAVDGATARLTGSVLTVQVSAQVTKGTTLTVPVSVTDTKTAPVAGTVTVHVVASTKPLATANDDVVNDAKPGQEVLVPVLDNDANPFPGTPLKLTGAPMVTTGRGMAQIKGNQVAVTPDADFRGLMVITYRVQDATNDPDRQVEGRIRLTVLGRPDTPGRPSIQQVRAGTVVLSWTPPNNNGSEITGYTVTSNTGTKTQCPTTTCTITGLQNNVDYTFTVVAKNSAGESDPSAPSATVRPDEKPDPPAAPSVSAGDGKLTITWRNATYTDRSPITCVNIEIDPTPASGGVKSCITGTSYQWSGLTNGTGYRVRLAAVNSAQTPSDPGAWSTVEVPAGKPGAPGKPRIVRGSLGSQVQMLVNWDAPADNGSTITGYTIEVLRGGSVTQTLEASGSARSQTINVAADPSDYTFRVRATNKSGAGEYSPLSDPMKATAAPGLVSGLATASTNDGQMIVAFAPPYGWVNSDELTYQYRLNGGEWRAMPADRLITGLQNGTTYVLEVRAVLTTNGVVVPGAAAKANFTSTGALRAPKVTATNAAAGQTQTALSWEDPGSAGLSYSVEIQIDGGGWEVVSNSGTRNVGTGTNQTHTICARTVGSKDHVAGGTSNCATGRTGSSIAPALSVTRGSASNSPACDPALCAYIFLRIRNAEPNTAFRAQCWTDNGGSPQAQGWESKGRNGQTLSTDGSGNYDGEMDCVYGNPGGQVWVETDGWGNSSRLTWS